MRKPTICICENKDADQFRGVTAKLISAFVFATRIVQYLYNFKPLAISSGCTAWFVSDQVKIHIVGFLMSRLIYQKQWQQHVDA